MSRFREAASIAVALTICAAAPVRAADAAIGPVLTLTQALRAALEGAPVLAEADATIAAERARLGQARLRPNPEIGLRAENFGGARELGAFNGTEFTAEIGTAIETGGRRAARIGVGEASVALAGVRGRLTRADLERAVRDAHARAAAAAARVELARTDLGLAGSIADAVGKLVAAGKEPPLRARRADVERATAEAALGGARQEQQAVGFALGALLGRGDVAYMADPAALDARAGVAVAHASDRVDVTAARAEAERARASIALERSQRILQPTVSIGVRRLELDNQTALVAGVTVPFPLFNRNGGAIAAARAEALRAEAAQARVEAETNAQAATARGALTTAEAQLALIDRDALPAATEGLRVARIGYGAGKFGFLDLLDAQRSLSAVRRQRIDAALNVLLARAALDRATGRSLIPGDVR